MVSCSRLFFFLLSLLKYLLTKRNPRTNIFFHLPFFLQCTRGNVAYHAFQVHTQTLQGQLFAKIALKTHFLLTKVATRLAKHAALVVHLAMEVPSAVLVAQANEFMSLVEKKRALIV